MGIRNWARGLQFDVWRDPNGLDGRDVGADDFGIGEFLGEITDTVLAACPFPWAINMREEGVTVSYMAQMPASVVVCMSIIL